jgi:hypothetical protein
MKVTRKENSVMAFVGISEAFSFSPPIIPQCRRSVPRASNAEIDLFKPLPQAGAAGYRGFPRVEV